MLCEEKMVEKDQMEWRCLVCLNCDNFIFAERMGGGAPLYINLMLQTKTDLSQRTLSSFYSPVWKIILKDESEQASTVLEPPEVEDLSRYAVFKDLQVQMLEYLKEEEQNMQRRIREYEQKQQEELRELQTRAYRDRKVLWHLLDEQIIKQRKKDAPVAATDRASATEQIHSEESLQAKRPSEQTTGSVSQPTASAWKNTRRTQRDQGGDWLFQFDDELGSSRAPEESLDKDLEDDLATGAFSDDEDYSLPAGRTLPDSPERDYHMASSLPVAIPAGFGRPVEREPAEPARVAGSHRRPLEGGFDTPVARNRSEERRVGKEC